MDKCSTPTIIKCGARRHASCFPIIGRLARHRHPAGEGVGPNASRRRDRRASSELGGGRASRSRCALDHCDQFVAAVAMAAPEIDELFDLCNYGSLVWCAGDGDCATAAHLEEAFVAQQSECAQDRVGVHAEHGGEVASLRDAFAGLGFAVADRAADLGGDLLVQQHRIGTVDRAERGPRRGFRDGEAQG